MNKKKSITIFVIVGVLLLLGIIFGAVPTFQIGNSMYDYTGYVRSIKLGLDLAGGVSAVFEVDTNDAYDKEISAENMKSSLEGVKKSMEDLLVSKGYSESVVTYNTNGVPTITVEIPDVDDPERVFDLIGRPASLEITKHSDEGKGEVYIFGSEHLEAVGIDADQKNSGFYVITLKFNKKGTTAFANATRSAVDGKFGLDIYISDEKIMNNVSVNEPILNGQAIISNERGYTYEDAYDYATRLQAGTFGLELTVRETNIISPVLGSSAIKDGLIAGLVGLVIVMIFMVVFYGMFGLMADLALIAYTELTLFLCSVLPWVQLTLPGIAGIVIGIGMAVDANIIIFERIKDEYRTGLLGSDNIFLKPTRGSDGKITSQGGPISRGFKKATVAVIDANITTIIGAAVLWIFGGTSIVGFAVTLLISIVVSMFTSLVVTRLLISLLSGFDNMQNPNLYKLKKSKEVAVNE